MPSNDNSGLQATLGLAGMGLVGLVLLKVLASIGIGFTALYVVYSVIVVFKAGSSIASIFARAMKWRDEFGPIHLALGSIALFAYAFAVVKGSGGNLDGNKLFFSSTFWVAGIVTGLIGAAIVALEQALPPVQSIGPRPSKFAPRSTNKHSPKPPSKQ